MRHSPFERSTVLTTIHKNQLDLVNDGACVCIVDDYDYKLVKCIDIEDPMDNKFVYRKWDNVFCITNDAEHIINESNTNNRNIHLSNTDRYSIGDQVLALYPNTTTFYSAEVVSINEEDISIEFICDQTQHLLHESTTLNESKHSVTVPSVFVFNPQADKMKKNQALQVFTHNLRQRQKEKHAKDAKYNNWCSPCDETVEYDIDTRNVYCPKGLARDGKYDAVYTDTAVYSNIFGIDILSQSENECEKHIDEVIDTDNMILDLSNNGIDECVDSQQSNTSMDSTKIVCIKCDKVIEIGEPDEAESVMMFKKCMVVQAYDESVKEMNVTKKLCPSSHEVGMVGARDYIRSTFYYSDSVYVT
eukprot:164616_1